VHHEFIRPHATPSEEAQMAKLVSLIVKFGALVFILTLDPQYAINFQLLGGIWIVHTLPSVVFGLYTRWFNSWALLAGWAVGIVWGTWQAVGSGNVTSSYPLVIGGFTIPGYLAVYSVILNIAVAVILSLVAHAVGAARPDETTAVDYQ
jgi:SSS family solute:Na+ symporter